MNKSIMNNNGFSLVEMLIASALMVVIMASTFQAMSIGQKTWNTSIGKVQVKNSLRQAANRIMSELRQSSDAQVTVTDDFGSTSSFLLNGTDLLTFAIPVIYNAGDAYVSLDIYGDTVVSNWGAPLTWGCNDVSCMSANYTHITYSVSSGGILNRRVVDSNTGTTHLESVIATDISGFEVDDFGSLIHVQITSSVVTDDGRTVTEDRSVNVYLRN